MSQRIAPFFTPRCHFDLRQHASADAAVPARRRGEYGPGYRFVGPMNGTKVQVVVQTGEELDYPDGIAATLKPRTITHGSALVR